MSQNAMTGVPHARHRRMPKAEYWAYFSLILAISLPWALAQWVISLFRPVPAIREGVLHAAWSRARILTPRIFSA